MIETRDRVYVNIPLQTIFATRASFDALVLVDDNLIPTDTRRLVAGLNSYTDTVGTSGTLFEMCRAFFQTTSKNPEIKPPKQLIFGRIAESATSPVFVCGDYESDYTVWKSVTDGTLRITDSTNDDDLTGLDFSSVNSMSDVITVLNTAMAALVPNITGMDTAVWSIDALGRLALTNSTTGSSAATFSITDEGTGTDLSALEYIGAASGVEVPGLDAETLLEGYSAIKLLYTDFWCVLSRGGDDAEVIELARQIDSNEDRFSAMFEDSGSAPNSASATDLASVASGTWGLERCSATFSYTEPYPDLANIGASLGAREGSTAFGFVPLANVVTSGQAVYNYALTPVQREALGDKNYNWIEHIGGYKSAYPGRSVAGQEIRLLMGRDWIGSYIASEVWTARMERRILGYDNDSLTVYEEIITAVLTEAEERNIIQSFVIHMPTEDDFTALDKVDHIIELDCFDAEVVTDAWRYELSGRLTTELAAAA